MNEILTKIQEVAIENKLISNEKNFKRLLHKNFSIVKDSIEEKGEELADVHFKIAPFMKDLPACFNGIKRSELYKTAAEVLYLIFSEFSVEIEKEECFVWFHFREIGKFRMKEEQVMNDLKAEWGLHKEFTLDKANFEYAVRQLKNHGLINLRRGSITLPDATVFRYKY